MSRHAVITFYVVDRRTNRRAWRGADYDDAVFYETGWGSCDAGSKVQICGIVAFSDEGVKRPSISVI